MTTHYLTCEAIEATLPDYLDETLEPWLRQSIDEHLAECQRCAALARDMRNMEREAGALPALVPERDLWPEVAYGIGAPVITSESVPESEPAMAPSEPPVLASTPPAIDESSLQTTEPPVPESEPVMAPSEPSVVASSSLPISEQSLPTTEPPMPAGEPVLASAAVPVHTTPPPIALAERREKRWRPAGMGLAAAALVLVTAGTTFLLTVRFGPARTLNVVADTATKRLSSSVNPPPGRGILAASVGRQQIVSDSSAPAPPPGPLASSLTVATTSAAQFTRSPDDVVYDKEIKMLQTMRRRREGDLDASTTGVIERNLRIIDSNIAQIRAALQKDPASSMLGDQESRALDMKVELLRRVALLRPNT